MIGYFLPNILTATVAYFDSVGIEYFTILVILWEMLSNKVNEFLPDIRFCLYIKRWIKPDDFSFPIFWTDSV